MLWEELQILSCIQEANDSHQPALSDQLHDIVIKSFAFIVFR
jgi:hypothetical protein